MCIRDRRRTVRAARARVRAPQGLVRAARAQVRRHALHRAADQVRVRRAARGAIGEREPHPMQALRQGRAVSARRRVSLCARAYPVARRRRGECGENVSAIRSDGVSNGISRRCESRRDALGARRALRRGVARALRRESRERERRRGVAPKVPNGENERPGNRRDAVRLRVRARARGARVASSEPSSKDTETGSGDLRYVV